MTTNGNVEKSDALQLEAAPGFFGSLDDDQLSAYYEFKQYVNENIGSDSKEESWFDDKTLL
jgi:hypothetical protein